MLTIVYCSEKRDLKKDKNFSKSEGVEILWFQTDSFSKQYNEALKKAKHDVVVFLRDDVEIMTKGWVEKLLEHFNQSQFGILGTVGSIIVPMSGLVWEKEEPLIGRIWYESFDKQHEQKFSENFTGKEIPVIALDDSFFAVHRGRLQVEFDEQFDSDSFYDLDFFVRNYQKKVKIGVIFEIKVLKLTMNPHDEAWKENRFKFIKKHTNLPIRLKPEILMQK